MALEDILKALDQKAETRIAKIKAEAAQEAERTVVEAEKEAERTQRLKLKKIEAAVRSEATGIVYSASLKAKNELILAQEEVVEEAFKQAEQHFAELHRSGDYPKLFEALLDQSLEFLSGEVVFEVRAEDRALIEKLASERGLQYKISDTPLEASGGLFVSSEDGSIVVANTFESRLEKAKGTVRLEIAKALFESA